MYKVVVIDDNPLVTESIVKSVSWESLDCVLVGTANNGVLGKKLIYEQRPNIIITDIKMPGLDGLEMLELSRSLIAQACVLLISGYSDFQMAQKAIRLGAFDYILKPIDPAVLSSSIRLAIKNLAKQSASKEIAKLTQSAAVAELINTSEIPQEKQWAILEEQGMRGRFFGLSGYFLIDSDLRKRLQASENNLQEKYPDDFCVCLRQDGYDIAFFCMNSPQSKLQAQRHLQSLHQQLLNGAGLGSGKNVIHCYSDVIAKGESIQKLYQSLLQKLDYHCFIMKTNQTLLNTAEHTESNDILDIIRLDVLFKDLGHMEQKEIDALADKLIDTVGHYADGSVAAAKNMICGIFFQIARLFRGNSGEDEINRIISTIQGFEDINKARSGLKDYLKFLQNNLISKPSSYSLMVKEILHYIQAHCCEDLTVQQAADHFLISPGYFCSLLKKETGETFAHLVNQERMKLAKEMLRNPSAKVGEICLAVGYKDYIHFYKLFKKYEGCSPVEYRNRQ